MRGLLAGGLALTVGLWAASIRAGDRPAPGDPANSDLPTISLGRPVALAEPAAAAEPALRDQGLQPTAFHLPTLGRAEPLVRAQVADGLQPLPAGPALDGTSSSQTKQPPPAEATPETLNTPRLMPAPSNKVTPAPVDGLAIMDCGPECCDVSGPCCGRRHPLDWLLEPGNCVQTPPYRLWFDAEYLLWAIKDSRFPALVTTSPATTPRAFAGVLPAATTLFGGNVDNEERSGGRFTLGFWLDPDQTLGIEGGAFFLGDRSVHFVAGSSGLPILARPFFDAMALREASELVAFPGVLAGTIAIRSESQFHGAELNVRENLWKGCCWRFDVLYGVRYLGLDENLTIGEALTAGPASGGLAGSSIAVSDSFGTHNEFWGGQLGMDFELRRGSWSLNLLGKVAFGDTRETVNIAGSTFLAPPNAAPTIAMGGFLAQPTNIGKFARDRFAVAPEAGVKLGYQLTDWMKLTVGYTFIYLSDVARPANQIDRVVNVSQLATQLGGGTLVGPARPSFIFKGTDFWAQGLTLGMELRW